MPARALVAEAAFDNPAIRPGTKRIRADGAHHRVYGTNGRERAQLVAAFSPGFAGIPDTAAIYSRAECVYSSVPRRDGNRVMLLQSGSLGARP